MRVRVDRALCEGHARCWSTLPEVYELDDDGYSAVTEVDVPERLEQAARRGASSCPERAISVVEDT